MEVLGYLLIAIGVGLIGYFIFTPDKGKGAVGAGCSLFLIFFSILIGAIFIVGGCIVLSNARKKKAQEEEGAEGEIVLESEEPPALPSSDNEVTKLREYKQLLDEGVITQEEYEAKKKQLLGL